MSTFNDDENEKVPTDFEISQQEGEIERLKLKAKTLEDELADIKAEILEMRKKLHGMKRRVAAAKANTLVHSG